MPLWARFLLAIIIAVVLSVLFPVGGFWAILSLLILFGIFEGLARIFPKYGHWLVVLLAAILIINFGVVRIISDHFKKNMPLTSEALKRRQVDADRKTAEQVNPPGLFGKRALYLYKKSEGDRMGAELQKELKILEAKRKAGTFAASDTIKEKEILAKIEAQEKWYRELTPDSDKNLEQTKVNKLAPTIFVWILGAIGLGVLVLGGVLKNKTLNGVGGLLIFLAIGLWAYQAFWPGTTIFAFDEREVKIGSPPRGGPGWVGAGVRTSDNVILAGFSCNRLDGPGEKGQKIQIDGPNNILKWELIDNKGKTLEGPYNMNSAYRLKHNGWIRVYTLGGGRVSQDTYFERKNL